MSHNSPIEARPDNQATTSGAATRVALVSKDANLKTALNTLFETQPGVELTDLASANVLLWDDALSDCELPSAESELPKVVLLDEASRGSAAIESGAKGVMLRSSWGPALVSALQAVRGGLTVFDSALAETLVPKKPELPSFIDALTARETEVVALLADGLSNKEIAKELGISDHTAKFHIGRILMKLDADSRTEAVVRALRYGIVAL